MEYKFKIVPLLDEYMAFGVYESPEGPLYNIIDLNEIGKDIFEMFLASKSEEEMVAALLKEYNSTEAQMTEVVRNFTKVLEEKTKVSSLHADEICKEQTPPAEASYENRKLAAKEGKPYDEESAKQFRILYEALKKEEFPELEEPNKTDEEFKNFALFESYFSSYVPKVDFSIDEAREIIQSGEHKICEGADTHDVLGIYQVVSDRKEMSRTPETVDELIDILQHRHSIITAASKEIKPGLMKDTISYVKDYYFVDSRLMRGTMEKGFEYYKSLPSPFAKALFMLFMIVELHPFKDGNGRLSRVMMNAELVAAGESKILIPTLYIYNMYHVAVKTLSYSHNPEKLITVFTHLREFSRNITGADYKATKEYLGQRNAYIPYKKLLEKLKNNQ